MIYNDHKKYTSALLTLNSANVLDWIKKEGIQSHDKIIERIKTELLLFNNLPEFKDKFPAKWIPSGFQIIEEDFSEENKMINSTLKMVRHRIAETYQKKLDIMYNKNAQQLALDENLKVISKMFSKSINEN